jgi:signal transduction histidine kinase
MLIHAPWPVFIWNPETGVILEANPAAARRYGYRLEDFSALRASDIVSARVRSTLTQLTALGQAALAENILSEHVTSSGEAFPVEVISFALPWKGQPARFSLIRDRRPGLDLVRDSSYLASLENMARISGAIAHNFNNLLTITQLAATHLRETVPPEAAQQADLIASTVAEASLLAQQLLQFGHRRPSRMEPCDLAAMVHAEQDILEAAMGKGTKLRLELTQGCWAVVDRNQCREILLNLVVNAVEAMTSGGICTLRTAVRHLPPEQAGLDLEHGNYVVLSVEDTGCGMSTETMRHALEPHFSTKPSGHGLGLSSVHGIMRLHGGGLEIVSEQHHGTQVLLYFPAIEPPPE